MVSKTHGWLRLGEGWYRHGRDPNILVNLWEFDPAEINGKGRHISDMEAHERADEGYVAVWTSPTSVKVIGHFDTKTGANETLPELLEGVDNEGIHSLDNMAAELGVRGVDFVETCEAK